MNFPEFMEKKYLEWQLKEEGRRTIVEFAKYLGISQPLLSQWLSGKKRPGANSIQFLVELYGNEVYDALGKERPNPYLQVVNRHWEFLDEDTQKQIAEKVAGYETQNDAERVHKASKPRKVTKHK